MKIIKLTGSDYTEYMKDINGARHKLKKSLWDTFGSLGTVRITSPSGRFIGIVRQDPGTAPDPGTDGAGASDASDDDVSDSVMTAQASSIRRMRNSGHVTKAPSPRSCKCAAWPWPENEDRPLDDKRKPLSHHPKCAFKKMHEREKGHKITHVAAGPTLEATIHRAGKISNPAISRARLQGTPAKADKLKNKTSTIPHPDRCPKCKDFTKSKKMEQDQHHPTCEYFKKYKAISHARQSVGMPAAPKPEPLKLPVMLMDLESMEVVREAEADEVQEARERLRDEGMAFVQIDERQYLCMYEDGTTLEPADGEPQGKQAGDTEPPSADIESEEKTDAQASA